MENDVVQYGTYHCAKCDEVFEQLTLFAVSAACPHCRSAIGISRIARRFGFSFTESLILGVAAFLGYKAIKEISS